MKLNIKEIEGLICKIYAKGSTASIELKDFVRNNPDIFEIIVDYKSEGRVKFLKNVLLIYNDINYGSYGYDLNSAEDYLSLSDFRILY